MSRVAKGYWISVAVAGLLALAGVVVGGLGLLLDREGLEDAMLAFLLAEFIVVAIALSLRDRAKPGRRR